MTNKIIVALAMAFFVGACFGVALGRGSVECLAEPYQNTFPLYTGMREIPANITLADGDEIWFYRVKGDSRYSLLVAYRSDKPFSINGEQAEMWSSLGEYYLERTWTEETAGVDKIEANSGVRFSYSTGGGFAILMKVGVNVPRGTP